MPDGAPHVLYTDIVSGPNSGGEGNLGAYLSIFGKNFGSAGLGGTVRVYIGGSEVGAYVSMGASRGRSDVQQITVRPGSLGNPAPGVALPIKVTVGGVQSNTDLTFKVNPGRMLYVDNAGGNDATAVPGDITRPYRHVQAVNLAQGAWGAAQPGDFIVLRGGTWTDVGRENYFMRFIKSDGSSGTAPTGASGSGPITVIGYPGEDAFINAASSTHSGGGLSGLNGINYPNAGKWVVIANLRIEGGGGDGPISQEIFGDHWRIVNNELSATTAPSTSKMGGITGNGADAHWLGNEIHDIHGSPGEAHGIYIDGDGSYEITFNDIHDIFNGNGFLMFANGGNGSEVINNVNFHHNSIAEVTKHLINVADGSAGNIAIWDNVARGASYAGVRFNTIDLHGMKLWNNTFYDMNRANNSNYGALTNDWGFPSDALDVRNNIFALTNGTDYTSGSVDFGGTIGTITHNLWFGGTGTASLDAAPLFGDPLFASAGSGDFHVAAGSPAVDAGDAGVTALVTSDYDVTTARFKGIAFDLGAFER
ncbi:MAG: hypothetical protein HY827_06070 [Actinobacteria bacterium]|nr:hypothetical protein [Actinomycetota bacterium]